MDRVSYFLYMGMGREVDPFYTPTPILPKNQNKTIWTFYRARFSAMASFGG